MFRLYLSLQEQLGKGGGTVGLGTVMAMEVGTSCLCFLGVFLSIYFVTTLTPPLLLLSIQVEGIGQEGREIWGHAEVILLLLMSAGLF